MDVQQVGTINVFEILMFLHSTYSCDNSQVASSGESGINGCPKPCFSTEVDGNGPWKMPFPAQGVLFPLPSCSPPPDPAPRRMRVDPGVLRPSGARGRPRRGIPGAEPSAEREPDASSSAVRV